MIVINEQNNISSFRITLDLEEYGWKPFRNVLSMSDRKKFLMRWCLIFLDFLHLSAFALMRYSQKTVSNTYFDSAILLRTANGGSSHVDQMMVKIEGLQKIIEEIDSSPQ